MRGVLLGQKRQPEHRLTIYVPKGYDEAQVVVGVCRVCQAKFGAGQEQAWQEHVGKCARANIDRLVAEGPAERLKGTPFDPNGWDTEVDDYMLNVVGPRMKAEGRFEVKPHERAGF